ncbi:hypothetical protein AB1Y20_018622 [Prymnesium parvum]|uniref:Actin n=1 Tax=Prymnesium parvum TaxID=97485 RepID=A0AB34JQE6_PRYPA
MSDDELDEASDPHAGNLVIVDRGASEWRAGLSTDDGPAVLLPSPPDNESTWRELFAQLRVRPDEASLLLSEPLGTSAAERARVATLLYDVLGVRAVLLVAPSVLALFASDAVSGVVVDVGERASTVHAVYEGHVVLRRAATLDLAGGHLSAWLADQLSKPTFAKQGVHLRGREEAERLARQIKQSHAYVPLDYARERGADRGGERVELPDGAAATLPPGLLCACGEAMFTPTVIGADGGVGLAAALVETVRMCDESLRAPLLANIVLVGGGSLLRGLPERLLHELRQSFDERYQPSVTASADRRYAVWMGGTVMCAMKMTEEEFVSKERYMECGVGALCPPRHLASIDSAPLAQLAREELQEAIRWKEEQAASERLARARAREVAAAARAWWLSQAPAGSEEEEARQQASQRVVAAFYLRTVHRLSARGGAFGAAAGNAGGAGDSAGSQLLKLAFGTEDEDRLAALVISRLSASWAAQSNQLDPKSSLAFAERARIRAWCCWEQATIAKHGIARRIISIQARRVKRSLFGAMDWWVRRSALQGRVSDLWEASMEQRLRATLREWGTRSRHRNRLHVQALSGERRLRSLHIRRAMAWMRLAAEGRRLTRSIAANLLHWQGLMALWRHAVRSRHAAVRLARASMHARALASRRALQRWRACASLASLRQLLSRAEWHAELGCRLVAACLLGARAARRCPCRSPRRRATPPPPLREGEAAKASTCASVRLLRRAARRKLSDALGWWAKGVRQRVIRNSMFVQMASGRHSASHPLGRHGLTAADVINAYKAAAGFKYLEHDRENDHLTSSVLTDDSLHRRAKQRHEERMSGIPNIVSGTVPKRSYMSTSW